MSAPDEGHRHRVFVSAWPDEATRAVLATLERPEVAGVRWTTPDQWHVTLRFLGTLDDEEMARLSATVRAACARVPATDVVLGPQTEALGRRVLVAPVHGLDEAADAVRAATASIGRPPDHDDFVGHLTLARRRRGRAALSDLAGRPLAATFRVQSVTITRSHRSADGAHYEVAETVPLGGGGAGAR